MPKGRRKVKSGSTLMGILAILSFVPTKEYLNLRSVSRSFAKAISASIASCSSLFSQS
ncbi:MAG: hypothetical protein IJO03_06715 [Clostridia bacterium]|nr:hypothetical protein [Clostridia bacterium]